MKKLLIFLIALSVFTFFSIELDWFSFIVLPILSLSMCLAIVMREHLFVSLSQSHQFVCLFLFSIFVLNLSVHFLNPHYIKPLFEISMAIVLTILVALFILRFKTKEKEKQRALRMLLQYAYLIFCFQMFPILFSS
jgi:hypothetical protein